jgi:hypothetical protein
MTIAPVVTPQTQVIQLLTSKMAAQALTQIAELGVADHLQYGPRTTAELATAVQANEDALYRTLRALAAVGFFTEHPGRVFANNTHSEILRTKVPGSMRAVARWIGEEISWWKGWGHLSHSLRTGKPAAEVVFAGTAFDFFRRHPRVQEIFQDAMTDFSAASARAVVDTYDFSGIDRIVDVGGGHGALLSAILRVLPGARGVLFDLPDVIESADATVKACGQEHRIERIAGNFLASVPAGADAYIMKHIIHDWDDTHCIRLLKNCRKAMKPDGRILIVEQVLTDAPESVLAKLLDLEMLVMTPGGRERTEPEFSELLREAGFRMDRVIPTPSPVCVIEALCPWQLATPADAALETFFREHLEAGFRLRPTIGHAAWATAGLMTNSTTCRPPPAPAGSSTPARHPRRAAAPGRLRATQSGRPVDYRILEHQLRYSLWLTENFDPYATDPRSLQRPAQRRGVRPAHPVHPAP